MTELNRAETAACLMTTRTQGWPVIQKILAKLVQDRMDKACDSIENAGPLAQRAGGAKEVIAEFNKIVAGLEANLTSETAPDWR
jgi:hypothetical protein